MKHLYYYIWIFLASIHHRISNILYTFNKVLFKIQKKSIDDQRKWIDDYNKSFLSYPGGMIDWAAFALFAGSFLFLIIGLTLGFNIDIYSNKYYFGGITIAIGAFCYYWIYFRNMAWLKDRINKVSKKYYLK